MQGSERGWGFSSRLPLTVFRFVLALLGLGIVVQIDNPPCATFRAVLSQPIPPDVREKLCTDILALLPQESVVDLEMDLLVTEEFIAAMLNLEILYLFKSMILDGFLLSDPDEPNPHKKLPPLCNGCT